MLIEERLDLENHFEIVGGFTCGTYEPLDNFIKNNDAFEYNNSGIGNTFLMFNESKEEVVAYFTLRANSLLIDQEFYPVIELARLAVNVSFQRMGIGTNCIIENIIPKAIEVRKHIGVSGILVFAETPEALGFYKKIGFNDFGVYDSIGKNDLLITDDGFNDKCNVLILSIDDESLGEMS